MASRFPGWLSAREVTQKYGLTYDQLRFLLRKGVFTRGVFSPAKERPPIYVRAEELRAWKRGGIEAVQKVRESAPAGAK
jgi:hypothetical protein